MAATTRSYEDEGEERFAALVPEHSLGSGQNDVQVFRVHTDGGAIVLDELEGTRLELVLKGDVIESGTVSCGSSAEHCGATFMR